MPFLSRFFPFLRSIFFLLFPFLASCSAIYRPNVVNQPMMSEEGQLQASLHTGFDGADLQGAYAVSDHFLVLGDFNMASFGKGNATKDHRIGHRLIEVGGGYYDPLGDEQADEGWVFEGIAGYGNARSHDMYRLDVDLSYSGGNGSSPPENRGYYHKIFFQPGIGYHSSEFEFGFGTRYSYNAYYQLKIREDGSWRGHPAGARASSLFIDHVFMGRTGGELVKFQFQTGFSVPSLSDHPAVGKFNTSFFILNFGLLFDLDTQKERHSGSEDGEPQKRFG